MALWNKGLMGAGPLLLVGVAGMVFGPRLLRLAGRATRPVARTALRSGVDVYDWTREGLGGLIEESRSDMEGQGRDKGRRQPSRTHPKRGPGGEPGAARP